MRKLEPKLDKKFTFRHPKEGDYRGYPDDGIARPLRVPLTEEEWAVRHAPLPHGVPDVNHEFDFLDREFAIQDIKSRFYINYNPRKIHKGRFDFRNATPDQKL